MPPSRRLRTSTLPPPRPSVRGLGLYPRRKPTISPDGHGPEVTRIRGRFFCSTPPLVRNPDSRSQTRKQVNQDMSTLTVSDQQQPELPCHVSDPDLWFADSPSDLERANELCTDCPVRRACLAEALNRAEPWGVWGGEILDRASVVRRKRPRGRPRKIAA